MMVFNHIISFLWHVYIFSADLVERERRGASQKACASIKKLYKGHSV